MYYTCLHLVEFFCYVVLVSSAWKNVGMTVTCSETCVILIMLFCRMKRGLTLRVHMLCFVIIIVTFFLHFICLVLDYGSHCSVELCLVTKVTRSIDVCMVEDWLWQSLQRRAMFDDRRSLDVCAADHWLWQSLEWRAVFDDRSQVCEPLVTDSGNH